MLFSEIWDLHPDRMRVSFQEVKPLAAVEGPINQTEGET
jgi:hypothetical protein